MKKSLKKLAALGMVAIMATAALAGCSSKEEPKTEDNSSGGGDGKKVELTMACWDEQQVKVMKSLGEAYNKKNPNITLKTQVSTWTEYWTKLEAGAAGGQTPDILWMNILHIEEYAEAGIVKDLTAAVDKAGMKMKEEFPEALVDGYTVDGKLYAIPKDFDTNALFYNKDLFDKAGVAYPTDTWTFEDFAKACEDLKAKLGEGEYATAIARNSGQTTYHSSIIANGGSVLSDDNTKSTWNDPKVIEGIQPWLDLVLAGYSPTQEQMTDTTPDTMFGAGKLAMYLSGNYMIPEYETNENVKGKFGIAKRPTFNGKNTDIINGLGYAVSDSTKNEEEATAFVTWLGSKEAMDIQAKAGVVISARNESQQLYVDARPDLNLKVFLENLDETHVLPHCKVTSELGTVEGKYLAMAWNKELTLKEACEKIAEENQVILDKMNGK